MKIALVCSHGGHLTEMLELREAFDGHETFLVSYESRRTKELGAYTMRNIGRNPLLMLIAFIKSIILFLKERPAVAVSTGAEIALPAFWAAKLMGAKTIFIESVCRINSPSISGRLVYCISDRFFVQWPQTLKYYGKKAIYEGGLI